MHPVDPDQLVQGTLAREHRARIVSLVDGKHYSTYVDEVKRLKQAKRYAEAEDLLAKLERAAEAEADVLCREPALWYATQLGIVRRKRAALALER